MGAALPPDETPLAQFFESLSERAERGDVTAACRLATDLDRCRQLPRLRDMALDLEHFVSEQAEESTAVQDLTRQAIEAAAFRDRIEALCAGVDAQWLREAPRFLLLAADAGDDEAALSYAVRPPMDVRAFLDEPEAWRTYRDRAPALLQRAARHGDARAMTLLYIAYSGGGSLFLSSNLAFPRDPKSAVYFGEAALVLADPGDRQFLTSQLRRTRALLSKGEYDAAAERGRALASSVPIRASGSTDSLYADDVSHPRCRGEVEAAR